METDYYHYVIAIVGACASGKSTLISGLTRRGYQCKHIAQEHSYVPDMWKRLVNPDILIYLDVKYETTLKRKKLNWSLAEYQEQVFRLKNAYEKADIRIETDALTPTRLIDEAEYQIQQILQRSVS